MSIVIFGRIYSSTTVSHDLMLNLRALALEVFAIKFSQEAFPCYVLCFVPLLVAFVTQKTIFRKARQL